MSVHSKYTLQDLIDIEQFQDLQNKLNEIYSFPSAIIDNDGNILTATAWQDICTQFHRIHPDCEKECIKSDQYILSHLHEANPAVSYRCPRGLVDNATPIIIDGVHYGNFFTGQFFLEDPDLDFFSQQAQSYGFNEEAYLAAVKRVPIWSQKQLENYLFFIKGLIEVISTSGLKKLKEIEARNQIEENEARAGAILDQMLDGFWMTSREGGRLVDVNPAMCRMLGYTREELLQLRVADIEANDSPEDIEQRIQQLIATGSAHFESRFRRKDGQVIDVEVSVNYLPSLDCLFGFHRDISDRKRAEKLLRDQAEQFRSIAAASPDAMLVTRISDGLILYANEQGDAMLAGETGALLNRKTTDFYANPADRQKFLTLLQKDRKVHNWEVQLVREDGEKIWAMVSAQYGIFEGENNIYVGLREITDRKQAEKEREDLFTQAAAARDEITASKNLLNGILDRVSDGFVAFDADFNYTYVNAHGGELLGRKPEELIGKNYWAEYPEAKDTPFANAYLRAMQTQEPVFFEDYYVHWDRWFINRIYPSKEGLTIFFTDITERKRNEEVTRRLNRELRAISDCNQVLVRVEDEQTILEDICRIVCDEAGYRMAWVGYAEQDEAMTVRPVAWAGYDAGYIAQANITWQDSDRGRGPTGTAIRSGKTITIQDLEKVGESHLWRNDAVQRGYHSSIALPLKDESGSVFGSFNIYASERNAFTGDEIRLLEELAGDLAFGITVLRSRARSRQAEDTLRRSEAKFRAVIENSQDGLVFTDAASRVLYSSPSMSRINGYTDDERLGKAGFATIYPADLEKVQQIWTKILSEPDRTHRAEYRIMRKDGSARWVESSVQNLLQNPHIQAIVISVRDITDRKQADEILHVTTSKLETIIAVSPLAIILVDQEDQVQLWNRAAENIFGWSAAEVVGKPNPVVPVSMRDEYLQNIDRMQRGYSMLNTELKRQRKDGSLVDVSISSAAVYDPEGNLAGRMAIIQDISERVRTEQALIESEEQYRNLFENMHSGFILLDVMYDLDGWPVDHRLLQANAEFGAQTGLKREEEIGKYSAELTLKWPDETVQRFYEIASQGGTLHIEDYNQSLNRYFDVRAFSPRRGQWAMLFGDITERKLRENELQTIASLSAALRTAPTRAEMLPVIIQQIVNLLRWEAVTIEITDPHSGDSIVEAGYGPWQMLLGLSATRIPGSAGVTREPQQPYWIDDLANEPTLLYPDWATEGLHGVVGVPLVAHEKHIGYIWVGARGKILPPEVRLLSAIADIAANAIHRATLHEQTQKDAADLARAYQTTLEGWAFALELRDQDTEGHTRRVTERTVELARIMGVPSQALIDIRRGALLHDIGKMGIPDSVLLKPGTLNEREWEIMRRHPEYAHKMLKKIDYLSSALDIPYCHHEKWDGSGYPRGLKGEEIPLYARIFAIVDVWDALTTDRIYRPAWSVAAALQHIRQESGRHFDPQVVEAFQRMLDKEMGR